MPSQVENKPKTAGVKGDDKPAISIQDVAKAFGEQVVLDGVSFDIKRGETLAVLGRSGTGKSVLLKIIIGLTQPDRGAAMILEQNMAEMSPKQISDVRVQMGFLFQHAALYDSLTVEENVAFPMAHHRMDMSAADKHDRVQDLLKEVGLEGHSEKMPSNISGGMQKRVGLARALALDPVILLLDEPTAGLDPIGSGEIDELILKLQQEHQMASIVVTHDLLSARTIATRIALLDKGKIVIEGSFEDLLNSDDAFVAQFLHRGM